MYRESLKRDLEWLLEYPAAGDPGVGVLSRHRRLGVELSDCRTFTVSMAPRARSKMPSPLPWRSAFEPLSRRINQPHVYLTRSDLLSRSLKFHIEGQISYENMDEEIKFDTVLELISGEYEVK